MVPYHRGAPVQAKANVNAADCHSSTPLLDAAAEGHTKVMELLLQRKADANSADEWGRSALHLLSSIDAVGVIEPLHLLLKVYANSRPYLPSGMSHMGSTASCPINCTSACHASHSCLNP